MIPLAFLERAEWLRRYLLLVFEYAKWWGLRELTPPSLIVSYAVGVIDTLACSMVSFVPFSAI